MGHERLPEHEGTHFRVWLVMEQKIQRMVDGLLLAAVLGVAVEVEGQASHGLRQDADAGIHRRHLHGAPLGDSLAGGGAAEEKGVAAPGGAVLGSVPRTEKAAEKAHRNHAPSLKMGKRKAPTVSDRCFQIDVCACGIIPLPEDYLIQSTSCCELGPHPFQTFQSPRHCLLEA